MNAAGSVLRNRATARFGQGAAVVGAGRDDIQQHHGHTGIGDLGGDACPHRAGADHAYLADHHTRSRMVAMPWPPPMHWLASA